MCNEGAAHVAKPTRILIAEDDPISNRLLSSVLTKWGYDVVSCVDGGEAWEKLQEPDAPRVALLDWMMPVMDGPQICRRLRNRPESDYTYVILITAKDNKDDMVEGMEAGADDYVVKPVDHQELQVRLRAGERIIDLQDRLTGAYDALKDQAARDSLTGLLNRGAVMKQLRSELARAHRHHTPVSIVMADIDFFKPVNDTYGHAAGDLVLRELSRRLSDSIRAYDGVARLGGEEFLVLLPACELDCAVCVAERLRKAIADRPFALPNETIRVTISLGVAEMASVGGMGADALLHAADMALYRSKHSGRNRVSADGGASPERGVLLPACSAEATCPVTPARHQNHP